MAFVKTIKEDLNESKILQADMEWLTPEEGRLVLIKNIAKKLENFKTKLPTMDGPENAAKIKEEFDKALAKYVDSSFEFNNEIEDVTGGDWPKSSLLKSQDFQMIKKWLEKDWSNRKWKPVFKGSKDGHNSSAFHKACDNKGPTVTVIKSKAGKIFGGFIDLPWKSSGNYLKLEFT